MSVQETSASKIRTYKYVKNSSAEAQRGVKALSPVPLPLPCGFSCPVRCSMSSAGLRGVFGDMTGIEDRVRMFLETWAKRKTGELPAPAIDLTVSCQSCGIQIIQGEPVAFSTRRLLCKGCVDKGERSIGRYRQGESAYHLGAFVEEENEGTK